MPHGVPTSRFTIEEQRKIHEVRRPRKNKRKARRYFNGCPIAENRKCIIMTVRLPLALKKLWAKLAKESKMSTNAFIITRLNQALGILSSDIDQAESLPDPQSRQLPPDHCPTKAIALCPRCSLSGIPSCAACISQ